MLDEDVVLQHCDLRVVGMLAHDHLALDRFATCQELGLRHDRGAATSGFPALAAPLLLGLEAGGAADRGDFVLGGASFADLDDGVVRIVRRAVGLFAGAGPSTTAAGARAVALAVAVPVVAVPAVAVAVAVVPVVRSLAGAVGAGSAVIIVVHGVCCGVRAAGLAPAATATTARATTRAAVVVGVAVGIVRVIIVIVRDVVEVTGKR